jgi:hypothetical protein
MTQINRLRFREVGAPKKGPGGLHEESESGPLSQVGCSKERARASKTLHQLGERVLISIKCSKKARAERRGQVHEVITGADR